jgi:2-polyprenyl-3-methyl-5-hydroxy-6-metoxy-1,4-benzoquinol methylase
MNEATVHLLNALNRAFYAAQADEFSQTRTRPWAGFGRVLGHVQSSAPRVLDVGCGNGRLLDSLQEQFGPALHYVGLDASEPLLSLARQRVGGCNASFEHGDFVLRDPAAVLPAGAFDLVTLFAVLHHVPQQSRRLALLRAAAERLAPKGVLAFTLWRYDRDPRFGARRIAPGAAPLPAGQTLSEAELEAGDHLLRWGAHGRSVRYCHFMAEAELARLLAALDLVLVERFQADGASRAMNDYLVLRR